MTINIMKMIKSTITSTILMECDNAGASSSIAPRKLLRSGQSTVLYGGHRPPGPGSAGDDHPALSAEASVGGRCPSYTETSAVPLSLWAGRVRNSQAIRLRACQDSWNAVHIRLEAH